MADRSLSRLELLAAPILRDKDVENPTSSFLILIGSPLPSTRLRFEFSEPSRIPKRVPDIDVAIQT